MFSVVVVTLIPKPEMIIIVIWSAIVSHPRSLLFVDTGAQWGGLAGRLEYVS